MVHETTHNIRYLKPEARVYPRAEHHITPGSISPGAVKVMHRLRDAGFESYIVGGGVRDLLLGREPKDFDVATNARPEQIRELFRNSRLIGRRFRLAHVRFGQEIIEVSTFRAPHHVSDTQAETEGGHIGDDGRIIRDNVYGSIDEDVWRRDFTVNALFYSIHDGAVVDYVGGVRDIEAGLIRLIGAPRKRYAEDPVRLLRAVRFAAKLGFRIEEETEKPIAELAPLLEDIPPARRMEEVLKLFMGGCALQTFEQLRHYGLFRTLFAQTDSVLEEEEFGFPRTFLVHALRNTDERLSEGKPVTPGFLFAAMLWLPVRARVREHVSTGLSEAESVDLASDTVIARQILSTAIPRRFTQMAREIWQLQSRFGRRSGKRATRLLHHPRFRAAYDFLLLRAQAGEELRELADWWTEFQEQSPAPPPAAARTSEGTARTPRRRGRRRRRGARKPNA